MTTTTTTASFVAIHPFQGDTSQQQLAFAAGAQIQVHTQPSLSQNNDGWMWGTMLSNGKSGWFPRNYVVQVVPNKQDQEEQPSLSSQRHQVPAARVSCPSFPSVVHCQQPPFDNNEDALAAEDSGFTGAPMGGTSPALETRTTATASPRTTTHQSLSSHQHSNNKHKISSIWRRVNKALRRHCRQNQKTSPNVVVVRTKAQEEQEEDTDYHIVVHYTSPSEELAESRQRWRRIVASRQP